MNPDYPGKLNSAVFSKILGNTDLKKSGILHANLLKMFYEALGFFHALKVVKVHEKRPKFLRQNILILFTEISLCNLPTCTYECLNRMSFKQTARCEPKYR